MPTTNDRLRQYIDFLDVSVRDFAKEVGISHATIYNSSNVGTDVLARIKAKHPRLSLDWLVCDTGPMLTDQLSVVKEPEAAYETKRGLGVPFYDHPFSVNLVQGIENGNIKPADHFYTESLPPVDFWVRASGSGMEKRIPTGSMMGLREVKSEIWNKWLPPGEVYALTTEDFALIRIIEQSAQPEMFQLTTQDNHGSSQNIPKELIRHIYKVVTVCTPLY